MGRGGVVFLVMLFICTGAMWYWLDDKGGEWTRTEWLLLIIASHIVPYVNQKFPNDYEK